MKSVAQQRVGAGARAPSQQNELEWWPIFPAIWPAVKTFGAQRNWRIVARMPQNQIIGLALMGIAVIDTAVGHLLIAPRVAEDQKRAILKVAFSISGVGIAAVGWAIYKGIIVI